jgi:hypothetical protein
MPMHKIQEMLYIELHAKIKEVETNVSTSRLHKNIQSHIFSITSFFSNLYKQGARPLEKVLRALGLRTLNIPQGA